MIIIFTNIGHNTAECYNYHIVLTMVCVTGGSSPQPLSLLRPATLVQIQGSTFNTGNKYECAKVNNLL